MYWLGSRIVFRVSTAHLLEKHFKLCQRTFVKYATSFNNLIILKHGSGCPTSFDYTSEMVIDESLSGPSNMMTASCGKLLSKDAELTASRRKIAQQQFQVPHRSTIFLLGKRLMSNLVLAN